MLSYILMNLSLKMYFSSLAVGNAFLYSPFGSVVRPIAILKVFFLMWDFTV